MWGCIFDDIVKFLIERLDSIYTSGLYQIQSKS